MLHPMQLIRRSLHLKLMLSAMLVIALIMAFSVYILYLGHAEEQAQKASIRMQENLSKLFSSKQPEPHAITDLGGLTPDAIDPNLDTLICRADWNLRRSSLTYEARWSSRSILLQPRPRPRKLIWPAWSLQMCLCQPLAIQVVCARFCSTCSTMPSNSPIRARWRPAQELSPKKATNSACGLKCTTQALAFRRRFSLVCLSLLPRRTPRRRVSLAEPG
jgi:hypothetical protein